VAVSTFVFEYAVTTPEDEELSLRARTTLVLVKERSEWKVVHEYLSPFKSNP
jgi:hypothetical protein